jgi:Flp pilus assembly protein TadG
MLRENPSNTAAGAHMKIQIRALRALCREDAAGVAISFALVACALLTLGGLALDYERATSVQSALQQTADAAALAAAHDPYYSDGQIETLAQSYVKANIAKIKTPIAPSIAISRDTQSNVNVSITASVPTRLMHIAGFKTLPVSVTAKAGVSLGDTEIYAAIDMSASLGIAADPAARAALEALTRPYMPAGTSDPQGCSFACHQRDGWEPAGKNVYDMAKAAGIPLREDVLNTTFGTFVDSFLSSSDPGVAANHKRMAVIGFSASAKYLLPPTNNAATVKAAPAAFPAASRLNTLFEVALPQIQSMIGPQGKGISGSPRKTLLLVTDGQRWFRKMGTGPVDTAGPNGPINTSLCDNFKTAGITVAVIEVKYVDDTGEYNFDQQVAPIYASVTTALQACASPGFYFQATDSDAATLAATFSQAADAMTQVALLK